MYKNIKMYVFEYFDQKKYILFVFVNPRANPHVKLRK